MKPIDATAVDSLRSFKFQNNDEVIYISNLKSELPTYLASADTYVYDFVEDPKPAP